MRYAIFSDIHGNLPAWRAVLADIQGASIDVAICLGDVVGYGPKPQEVLDGIRQITDNFVLGNHDAAAVGLLDSSIFNDNARTVVEWTSKQLNSEAHQFLSQVPLTILNQDLLFVHAEALEPGAFGYIEGVEEASRNFQGSTARVTFVGHTHHPTLFRLEGNGQVQQLTDTDQTLSPDNRYIINVGSAGEPRNPEDISARYVIFDDNSNEVFFRRIPFDIDAYREQLQQSGLSTRPYFLDVVDKLTVENQRLAMLADMQAPAQAIATPQAAQRRLVIPSGAYKPTNISPPKKKKTKWLVPLIVCLAICCGVGFFFYHESQQPEETAKDLLIVDNYSETIIDENSATVEAPVTEPDKPVASLAVSEPKKTITSPPADEPEEVVAATPAPAKPEPVPEKPTAAEPEPEEKLKPAVQLTGLKRDLVFYAPFDEPTDATMFFDKSGNHRNLQNTEKLTAQANGQVGKSCRFLLGGTQSDAIPFRNNDSAEVTISFWLRFNGNSVPGNEGVGNAISIPGWFTIQIAHLQLIVDMNGDRTSKTHILSHSKQFDHIFISCLEGRTEVFVNNKKVMSFAENASFKKPFPNSRVRVGSPKARYHLDELLIWNRSLSKNEMQIVFAQGKAGKPALAAGTKLSHWAFDDTSNSRLLKDSTSEYDLGAFLNWSKHEAIAPDPSPVSGLANTGAAKAKLLAVQPHHASKFELKANKGFNFSGWFIPVTQRVTICNTIGDTSNSYGWKLEALRQRRGEEFMALSYQTPTNKFSALASDLNIYDGKPHRFSARWQPPETGGEDSNGKLTLVVDGLDVASTEVPLSEVMKGQTQPVFQLGDANQSEMVIDEASFYINDVSR